MAGGSPPDRYGGLLIGGTFSDGTAFDGLSPGCTVTSAMQAGARAERPTDRTRARFMARTSKQDRPMESYTPCPAAKGFFKPWRLTREVATSVMCQQRLVQRRR